VPTLFVASTEVVADLVVLLFLGRRYRRTSDHEIKPGSS
jgi:hypothetical protein